MFGERRMWHKLRYFKWFISHYFIINADKNCIYVTYGHINDILMCHKRVLLNREVTGA